MNKKQWNTLKKKLKDFHPLTRIIKLTELLEEVEDKDVKNEIQQELKQAQLEIQDKRLWKITGPIETRRVSLEEQEPQLQRPQELEQVVQQESLPEEEEKPVKYGGSGFELEYEKKYERPESGIATYQQVITPESRENLLRQEAISRAEQSLRDIEESRTLKEEENPKKQKKAYER